MTEDEVEQALEELKAEGLVEEVPAATIEMNVSMDVKIDASVSFPDGSKLTAVGLKSGVKIAYSARRKRTRYPWGYEIVEKSALTLPYDKLEDALDLLKRLILAQEDAAQQQLRLGIQKK